jgi:hypothetical protein
MDVANAPPPMVKRCPANVQVNPAARQLGLNSAPMIVRDLVDEQMLHSATACRNPHNPLI